MNMVAVVSKIERPPGQYRRASFSAWASFFLQALQRCVPLLLFLFARVCVHSENSLLLFDFLHAGLPVVCSDLPVAGRFVNENGTGEVALGGEDDVSIARHIADAVQAVLDAPPDTDHLADVASRHHWGVHEEALLRAIHRPS